MIGLRSMWTRLVDSPTVGHHRSTVLAGGTVGIVALILTSAVSLVTLPFFIDSPSTFEQVTHSIGFGQLLVIILLTGSAAVATVLIPLRLLTVFWGPRIGRYFDQVVLSGVSPLQFVIGKVVWQNYFVGLILFLLLPYFVFGLTLGGVQFHFVLAGLVLVWLYCMLLAMATLTVSIYMNELLAAMVVICVFMAAAAFGSSYLPHRLFAIVPELAVFKGVYSFTPFPALLQPIHAALETHENRWDTTFIAACILCAAAMIGLNALSLCAIWLGPIFGIGKLNSSFGEVMGENDGQRRKFRIRAHVQRPSELAFFYENRGLTFRACEGIVRWGGKLVGLLLVAASATTVNVVCTQKAFAYRSTYPARVCHTLNLVEFGVMLGLAIIVFSHAKSSTFLRIPFCGRRTVEVSRLDTWFFLIVATLLTGVTLATPFGIENWVAQPINNTVFPTRGFEMIAAGFHRFHFEGTAVVLTMAVTIYVQQRYSCLHSWLRLPAVVGTAIAYLFALFVFPLLLSFLGYFGEHLRVGWQFSHWGKLFGMASPANVFLWLARDRETMPSVARSDFGTAPFYVCHAVCTIFLLYYIKKRTKRLRLTYLGAASLLFTVGMVVAPAAAQGPRRIAAKGIDTAGLSVEAAAGWDGIVDVRAPVPLSFLFQNHSERVMEGQLVIRDPKDGRDVVLGDLYLAPGATQRFSAVQDLSEWSLCEATFQIDGHIFWRRDLPLIGEHYSGPNNDLLVINPSGRRLNLFDQLEWESTDPILEAIADRVTTRAVRTINVKPWQLPNHPGPLTVAVAAIIPERMPRDELNDSQWNALSRWICLGGVVFVHHESNEIIQKLAATIPLRPGSGGDADPFVIHPLGMGAIYEYRHPIIDSQDGKQLQQIRAEVAQQTPGYLQAIVHERYPGRVLGQVDKRRMLVALFFASYVLFSGLVSLAFFRKGRTWITSYIVAVVVVASSIAVVLGSYIRMSKGSLRWMTVTQAGPGGIVQTAKIEAESANAGYSKVTLRGEHVDVQPLGEHVEWYHLPCRPAAMTRFSWHPNRLKGKEEDAYQIEFRTHSWGERIIEASAFTATPSRLEISIDFIANYQPFAAGDQPESTFGGKDSGFGRLSVEITNPLPFNITNPTMVFRVSLGNSEYSWDAGESMRMARPQIFGGLPSQYIAIRIPDIKSGRTIKASFMVTPQATINVPVPIHWERDGVKPHAWLMADLESSPLLKIDEGETDFVPESQSHLFFQEIPADIFDRPTRD